MNEDRDERLGELLARHVHAAPAIPEFTSRLWERIEKSGKLRRGRPAPLWRRRPLLTAAVVAGVAAVVLAVSLLGGGGTSVHRPVIEPLLKLGGPADASAAQVIARARTALATVRAIRARWDWRFATVDIPFDDLSQGLSVDEVLDRATVGPLNPYYPHDLTLTRDGRSRWEVDVSRELSGSEEDGKTTWTWTDGKAGHDMPPVAVDIRDAAEGTWMSYQPEMHYGDSWTAETAILETGHGAGPPDVDVSMILPMGPSPSAFSALENGEVRESTFEGRPALTVVAPVKSGPLEVTYDAEGRVRTAGTYLTIDKIEFTVDATTHLPVRMASYLRGKVVDVWTLSQMQVNVDVPESDFDLEFREGAPIERTDLGFRATTLDAVAGQAGYAPLVPTYVPPRFHLTLVRWAEKTRTWVQLLDPSGQGETREVTSRRVTSIGYWAGLLRLTVSMRPAGGLDPDWLADPFQVDPSAAGAIAPPERVTLASGALAGEEAQIAMPPLGVPHLWLVHDGMLVTVAGDVSRAELLRVAGSMEPVGGTQ